MEREALKLAKIIEHFDSNDESLPLELLKEIAATLRALAQPERDYERGFIDGMQKQMQSSVDKAVNRMAQPEQEPVAFDPLPRACNLAGVDYQTFLKIKAYMPVAPQRTWVGLTHEEIAEFDTWHDNREEEVGWVSPSEIVAYIEAKLKEKNFD